MYTHKNASENKSATKLMCKSKVLFECACRRFCLLSDDCKFISVPNSVESAVF